ncbi:hypothetical protein GCM10027082_33130 [Comamonas humi]
MLQGDFSAVSGNPAARPLRVLHIGKYYPPFRGGMESFLADLLEQQRASGIDARALVHGDPLPNDPEWVLRVPVQIKLVFAPIAVGFPLALWRAIRRFKPDVIHLHMPNNAAFWALVVPGARRIPWVVHWHSDVLISRWDWLLSACYQLYRPFEYKLLQLSEAILATSPPYMAASKPLQRWLYKTIAIPLGLKPLAQEHAAPAAPAPVAEWGDAELRILSVGRLTYYKGFDTLVSAVAGHPTVKLVIAGEGEQRPMLEELIAKERAEQGCANVELLGAVSEAKKHALFNSCDVFALASRERTEAFGLVLVEAMQHGKPCMVSDLEGSGMSWVVSQAEGGRCYAPDQVQAWKRAIEQCLASKSQLSRMGESAKEATQSQFTIAQCEQGIRNVYLRLLDRIDGVAIQHSPLKAGGRLQVWIAFSPSDLAAHIAAQPGGEEQILLINLSGDAAAAEPWRTHGLVIDLADGLAQGLSLSDAVEMVQLLALEQGVKELSIGPMAASGQRRRNWRAWVASFFGMPCLDLRVETFHLEGDALQSWLRTSPRMWGACLVDGAPQQLSLVQQPR